MMNPTNRLAWIYDLYLIGQRAGTADDPAPLRRELLEHVVRGFDASTGCLALKGEGPGDLTITTVVGLSEAAIGTPITLGNGILGQVAQTRQPMLLNGDLKHDSRVTSRNVARERPASAMCWPLRLDAQLVGTLSINRSHELTPFSAEDLEHGHMLVNMISVVIENMRLHRDQQAQITEMRRMNKKLEEAHTQLFQSEKLASIGQLAAGVAHEINNPVGYINSNLSSLQNYLDGLLKVVDCYQSADPLIAADPERMAAVERVKQEADLAFLKDDVTELMAECLEGLARVKRIVQDLKDFSHVDEGEWTEQDIHKGVESTLNIVQNEIKYKADVVREYGTLPPVECLSGQLNQVFMNLLVNAAHAIEGHGTITIRTGTAEGGGQVWVEVADDGKGILPEHMEKLFDPFFTTKPVGKGTGLGLSLAYGIVQRHHGHIGVKSKVGVGTTFRVTIPVRQHHVRAEAAPEAPAEAPRR
ncbi:MAG: GAF domain-containing protein [Nitrospirae bacterium]|nr:GAF domain-containing protein [Nitrospirota bacterium]